MSWNVILNIEIVLQVAMELDDYFLRASMVNRLKSVLCGKRGMVARGRLEKVKPNVYRLGPLAKENANGHQ